MATIATNESLFGEVDSVKFAIYLNKTAKDKMYQINVTKIHKLLYICYGVYIAVAGNQLLNEKPKAWDYGPAFPRVHKTQKSNNDSLDDLLHEIVLNDFLRYDNVINPVLDVFGSWSATELVNWTHKKNGAWHKKILAGERYESLDNYDILLDFKEIVVSE